MSSLGIRFNAGLALLKLHRMDEALAQFAEAARLRPDWAEPLNAHAWALATSTDSFGCPQPQSGYEKHVN